MVSITVHGSKLSLWPLFNANDTDNVWKSTDFSFLRVFSLQQETVTDVFASVLEMETWVLTAAYLKKPGGGGGEGDRERERLGSTDVIQPCRVLQVMCWWRREGRCSLTVTHKATAYNWSFVSTYLESCTLAHTHAHTHTNLSIAMQSKSTSVVSDF